MQWRARNGQATVEAALLIPLVVLLLLGLLSAGYAMVAQLLVVSSAGQGARTGTALCAEGQPSDVALQEAQSRALDVLAPLAGPKSATAELDGPDLVVTSDYTYVPPLPGISALLGGDIHLHATSRYRCAG